MKRLAGGKLILAAAGLALKAQELDVIDVG